MKKKLSILAIVLFSLSLLGSHSASDDTPTHQPVPVAEAYAPSEDDPDHMTLVGFGMILFGIGLIALIFHARHLGDRSRKQKEQEVRSFRNRLGCWEYSGPFSLYLTNDADIDLAPRGSSVSGRMVFVGADGKIKWFDRVLSLYAGDAVLRWLDHNIRSIRDHTGKLLWVNESLREE